MRRAIVTDGMIEIDGVTYRAGPLAQYEGRQVEVSSGVAVRNVIAPDGATFPCYATRDSLRTLAARLAPASDRQYQSSRPRIVGYRPPSKR